MADPVPPPPAAWHPDPFGRHELRYWNGATWTASVSDGGVVTEDAPERIWTIDQSIDAVVTEKHRDALKAAVPSGNWVLRVGSRRGTRGMLGEAAMSAQVSAGREPPTNQPTTRGGQRFRAEALTT